jgi:hypothetical protein
MPKNVGGNFKNSYGSTFKDLFGMSKKDAGQGAVNTLYDYLGNNPDAIQNGVFVGDTSGLTGRQGNALFDEQGNLIKQGMRGGPQPGTTPAPEEQAAAPQGPGVAESLVGQGVDLSNAGTQILKQPNLGVDPTLRAGNKLAEGGFGDIGAARGFAQHAAGRSGNIQNTIAQQMGAAQGDIQNYFNAQPLDTLRSRMSHLNAQNVASGRMNSRSGNEMGAELQRGLIRDQANALLGSNNQFRQAQLSELGQQRQTDLGLASLMSGQGLGQTQQGVGAFGQAGTLDNQTKQLGANIMNQGFQNQLGSLNFLNNAEMQRFQMQNQLLQQLLANIQGNKQNKQTMDLIQQQIDNSKRSIWDTFAATLGAAGGAAAGAF